MAKLKFKKEKKRTLEIHVPTGKGKEQVYDLPLSNSLDLGESMELMKAYNQPKKRRDTAFFMWFYDFACRHVDKRAIDSLSTEQFRRLADVWQQESEEDGASLGE